MKARELPIEPLIKSHSLAVLVQSVFRHVLVSNSTEIISEFSFVGIERRRERAVGSNRTVGGSLRETATAFPHTTRIYDISSDRPPKPKTLNRGTFTRCSRSAICRLIALRAICSTSAARRSEPGGFITAFRQSFGKTPAAYFDDLRFPAQIQIQRRNPAASGDSRPMVEKIAATTYTIGPASEPTETGTYPGTTMSKTNPRSTTATTTRFIQ